MVVVGVGWGVGTIHWTNDVTELRVSTQATGSNQDKPLGSHSALSLRADYADTDFSLSV